MTVNSNLPDDEQSAVNDDDSLSPPKKVRPLPVFVGTGRPLTPEEMDEAISERIKERAARR